ncbi:MAG: nuclear transport factor 2 family protein [Vicinamibacterales bacterium]
MIRALFAAALAAALTQTPVSPQAVVDELLAADRGFSSSAATLNVTDATAAMFSDQVIITLPTGDLVRGKAKAVEALGRDPDNSASRVEWSPLRGGISADGQHGFTFGYMTVQRRDRTDIPLKYLAYWIKQPAGWRVAVYKRGRRPDGIVARELMPPALPAQLIPSSTDGQTIAAHRDSLDKAERSFSDEAQQIGIGAAFAKYGSADAVNMGGSKQAAFVVGADAIGRSVGAGYPPGASPVSWSPDEVLVASSGDLGVTIGMIRPNVATEQSRPAVPFFTIWRRANLESPWRYVAE